MKLSVVQENLHKALGTVSRVVGSRTSLPVLANVLLKTEASRLVVSATNLEMAVSCSIGCKVEKEGSVTVPARLFSELIAGMPSDKLQLIATGDNLTIKALNFESQMNGIAASEFPATPVVKPEVELSLPAAEFIISLSEVVIAASVEDSRPVLAGVLMDVQDGQVTLAATDSYRLAEKHLPLKNTKKATVIIPAKTIVELNRMIDETVDTVRVLLSKTEVQFELNNGDTILVSRLIDGKFPNYQQIIPKKSTTQIQLSRSELMSTTKIAGLFARESSHTIKLSFKKTGLQLSAQASEVGANSSLVEGQLTGSEGEISINARYLLDVLGVLDTTEVILGINDKLEPCVVRPVRDSKAPQDYIHIIMPLRS